VTNGSLYSFWVTPNAAGASFGYVAAGGPGFSGPVDNAGQATRSAPVGPPARGRSKTGSRPVRRIATTPQG
jgi:hypothetical protein